MKFGINAIQPAQEAFSRGDVETAVNAYLRGITGRHINVDELPRAIREPIRANELALQAELDVWDPFTCLDARRISAPTLLVRGEQSPAFLGAMMLPHQTSFRPEVDGVWRARVSVCWEPGQHL